MHSFVVAGRGARQSALFLLSLGLTPLFLGSWPRRPRLSGPGAALSFSILLVCLVFADDSIGPLLGQAWLRPSLWLLVLLYSGGQPSLPAASPLPLGLASCVGARLGSSWGHSLLFLSLAAASVLSPGHLQIEPPEGVLGIWVSCGETWLSCWSESLSSQPGAGLGFVFYESSLARLNLSFLRRVGSVDILQQSLLRVGPWCVALSNSTPLIEPLLGLSLAWGLACLVCRKAPVG